MEGFCETIVTIASGLGGGQGEDFEGSERILINGLFMDKVSK